MSEVRSNQEKANLLMGTIFADLLVAWPTRVNLSSTETLKALFGNATRDDDLLYLWLIKWLNDEGYIRYGGSTNSGTHTLVVLSEKGLRTLNSIPTGISGVKSYGDRITEAAKDVTRETAKKTIADLAGQMIGGVIKSLST